jgi:hypothetical protein
MEPPDPSTPEAATPPADVAPPPANVTTPAGGASPPAAGVATPDASLSSWASEHGAEIRQGRAVPPLLAWSVALLVAAFNAIVAGRSAYGSAASPRMLGYVIGTFLGPFLIALIGVATYVVLRSRTKSGSRSILRSPWLPLGATILAGVSLATNVVAVRPPGPTDPSAAMRISGPFSLREASPETNKIAEAGFKGDRTIRAYAVREVIGEDGSLSLLVAANGPINDGVGAIERVARGIESASGLTATIESIRGRKVAIAVGETLSIGAWIEEPLGIFVYAVTPTRLHQIVEAVMDAPR